MYGLSTRLTDWLLDLALLTLLQFALGCFGWLWFCFGYVWACLPPFSLPSRLCPIYKPFVDVWVISSIIHWKRSTARVQCAALGFLSYPIIDSAVLVPAYEFRVLNFNPQQSSIELGTRAWTKLEHSSFKFHLPSNLTCLSKFFIFIFCLLLQFPSRGQKVAVT